MVDNKDKGAGEDFDEEDFDVEDLPDADYDEAFDEDLPEEEVALAEEDFDQEWQDEEPPLAKNKKDRFARGEKKSLSFNTIIIIIAFVIGVGVLLATISGETSQQQEAQGTKFQSMINITGILDGTLFGTGLDEKKQEEGKEITEQAEQDTGFLNPSTPGDAPPQPTPITPAEEGAFETATIPEPLTPMPADESGEQMPRSPEEAVPVVSDTEQSFPPEETAKDILNRAKDLREQKAAENTQAISETAPEIPTAKIAQIEDPASPASVLAPNEPEVVPPFQESSSDGAGIKIMQALEEKIGQVLSRMGGIEKDIAGVRETQKSDYKRLEERMASMQSDIDNLKKRPVASSGSPASTNKVNTASVKKKVKAPPVRDETTYSGPGAANAEAYPNRFSNDVWELRAAQPGRAWVSRSGSKDMQGVVVGDNLPGVGQVTNILYQNGRWTVQGTKGQILQ